MKRFIAGFIFTILFLRAGNAATFEWYTDYDPMSYIYNRDGTPLPIGCLVELWIDTANDGIDPPDNPGDDQLIATTTIGINTDTPGTFSTIANYTCSSYPCTIYIYTRAYNNTTRETAPYYGNSLIYSLYIPQYNTQGLVYEVESFSTTIPNPDYTAVHLLSFDARFDNGIVLISWKTGAEVNTIGFNIIRDDGNSRIYINPSLIPASFRPEGSSYSYMDTSLSPGATYYYYLEEVERNGNKNLYGPVSVRIPEDSSVKIEKEGNGYRIKVSIPGFRILSENGESLIKIDGLQNFPLGREGFLLPLKTIHIGIPEGIYRISIAKKDYEERLLKEPLKSVSCFELPGISIDEALKIPEGCIEPLPVKKGSDGFSPAEFIEVAGDYILRTQRVLKINIYPVRFSENKIKILKAIEFEVEIPDIITASPPDPHLESIYRFLTNYEKATSFRIPPAKRGKISLPPWDTYIKGECNGEGLFSVDLNEIRRILGEEFILMTDGNPQKYLLRGDRLYIYMKRFKSYWTEKNVFFIGKGKGNGAGEISASPGGGTITHFEEKLLFDDDKYLFVAIPVGDDGELWYMDFLRVGDKEFTFNIPYPVIGEPASIKLSFIAYTIPSNPSQFHHIKAFLNGIEICDFQWREITPQLVECDASSAIKGGSNALKIKVLPDGGISNDYILLDSVTFLYRREFKTRTGTLYFEINEEGDVSICCFNSSPLFVKIGDGIEGVLRDYIEEISSGGIQIKAHLLQGKYIIAENSGECEIKVKKASVPIPDDGFDFIIIGTSDFRTASMRLIERREREGLKTTFVDVDDIYDTYSDGKKDPSAIKSFIKSLMGGEKKPSYILLVGDGSYDPRNIYYPQKDFVPAKFLQTSYINYHSPSDTWFGAVAGDDIVPDLAVGRIPAESPEELELLIDKIEAFEDLIDNSAFRASSLFVADEGDGGVFIEHMEELMNSFPSEWTKIFLSWEDYNSDADRIKEDILSYVGEGVFYFNYAGHGSFDVWSKSPFFRASDMLSLVNSQPFILLPQDCLNGYFVIPHMKSIGESAIFAPNGGASASWVSSGFTTPSPQLALMKAFYRAVFENEAERIGDAVLFALGSIDGTGGWEDVIKTWVLLGDPTMRLKPIPQQNPPRRKGGILQQTVQRSGGCAISSGEGNVSLLLPPVLILLLMFTVRKQIKL